MIQGGASPNMMMDNLMGPGQPDEPALQWAFKKHNYSAMSRLLALGARPRPGNGQFLAEFLFETRLKSLGNVSGRPPRWPGLVAAAVLGGASLEGRSFCVEGYTPLMLATSDRVQVTYFRELVDSGANRRAVGRWYAGAVRTSVLQCLLSGLRTPHPGRGILTSQVNTGRRMRVPTKNINRSPAVLSDCQQFREGKFLALVGHVDTLTHHDFDIFVTPDDRHILEWAAENLYGIYLKWAVDLLSPYYLLTRPIVSGRSPLFSLFGTRRYPYNYTGTLYDTLRFARTMVSNGVPVDELWNGQTVLHLVCQLSNRRPNRQQWEAAEIMGYHELDLEGQDFFKQIKDDNRRKYGHKRVTACQVSYEDLTEAGWQSYSAHRLRNLQGLISLFRGCGLNIYAEDSVGKSAFEYAVESGIDGCIAQAGRDKEREKRILGVLD